MAYELMLKFVERARNPNLPKWTRLQAVTFALRAQTLHYRLTGELVELDITYNLGI